MEGACQPVAGLLQGASILRQPADVDAGVGKKGLLVESLQERLPRLVQSPQLAVSHPQIVVRLGENRLERDGPLQRLAGFAPQFGPALAIGQMEPAGRLIRRQCNRLAGRMFRLGHLVQPQVGCRQFVPAKNEIRVRHDRAAEVSQGLRPLAPELIQVAQVVVGDGIVRL